MFQSLSKGQERQPPLNKALLPEFLTLSTNKLVASSVKNLVQ